MKPAHPEIVKSTLLARKPGENSLLTALAFTMILLVVSAYCWKEGAAVTAQLAAIPSGVMGDGEYYRLLTAQAVHSDFGHFLRNAVLYCLFGYLLLGYFGFWVFPVGATVAGCLVNYLSLLTYPPQTRLVGASGVVYLMASFWLIMYMLIERRHSWRKRLMHGIGVGLIVLLPTSIEPSVSYRTHAIGAGLGVLLGLVYFIANMRAIRAAEVKHLDEEFARQSLELVENPPPAEDSPKEYIN